MLIDSNPISNRCFRDKMQSKKQNKNKNNNNNPPGPSEHAIEKHLPTPEEGCGADFKVRVEIQRIAGTALILTPRNVPVFPGGVIEAFKSAKKKGELSPTVFKATIFSIILFCLFLLFSPAPLTASLGKLLAPVNL